MTATTQLVRGCPSTTGNERQLNTTTLIRHAARTHGDQEIVYRTPDGGWDRYTYAECYARVCRSANALRALGVEPGDRVGILDWNSRRHFELYWSIPGLGAVMLQMNLRLGAEDLGYVVGHSKVSYVCVDESLLPIAESVAANSPQIKGWIVMTDKPLDQIKTTLKPLLHYEDLLAAARSDYAQILAAMYARGHYSAVIHIRIDGREAAGIPALVYLMAGGVNCVPHVLPDGTLFGEGVKTRLKEALLTRPADSTPVDSVRH